MGVRIGFDFLLSPLFLELSDISFFLTCFSFFFFLVGFFVHFLLGCLWYYCYSFLYGIIGFRSKRRDA